VITVIATGLSYERKAEERAGILGSSELSKLHAAAKSNLANEGFSNIVNVSLEPGEQDGGKKGDAKGESEKKRNFPFF